MGTAASTSNSSEVGFESNNAEVCTEPESSQVGSEPDSEVGVTELDGREIRKKRSIDAKFVEQTVQKIKDNDPSLVLVSLVNVGIDDEGARTLAKAHLQNTTVTQLELVGNHIGAVGAAEIAHMLHSNRTITEISLYYNRMNDFGATALSVALRHNTTVAFLNVGRNGIANSGANAMAEMLCHNTTVASIWLNDNEIGDLGATELAQMLHKNTTTNEIILANNHISDAGAAVLLESLFHNATITELDLSYNRISNMDILMEIKCLTDINKESKSQEEASQRKTVEFEQFRYSASIAAESMVSSKATREDVPTLQAQVSEESTCGELAGVPDMGRTQIRPLAHHALMKRHISSLMTRGNGYTIKRLDTIKHKAFDEEHRNREEIHRQTVKKYQENRVAREGASYFLCMRTLQQTHFSTTEMDENRLSWDAARVRQAAAGDGTALSALLRVLQWIAGEREEKEGSSKRLPPASDVLATALKNPNALKALVDSRLDQNDNSTMLHLAAAARADSALHVCQILVKHFGAEFDTIKDSLGRSARTIALANDNPKMIEWARRVGTLLGRYKLDVGPPIHKSATCSVVSGIDVVAPETEHSHVALKIFSDRSRFEHELRMRLVHQPGSGANISSDLNRFREAHVVKLYRYHDETDENGESVMCLVMAKAARNLDEIIRAEHVAGRELLLMKHIAVSVAKALHHLHDDHGIIHGDLKPKNVVRMESLFNLVDFDASLQISEHIIPGKKETSTGFCPPELAKLMFPHGGDLEELGKQRDDIKVALAAIESLESSLASTLLENKLSDIEEKITQLQNGGRESLAAEPTFDIWCFGTLMYYILTGNPLFRCNDADNLVDTEEKQQLVQWKGLSSKSLRFVLANCPSATRNDIKSAKDMLTRCLQPNPNDRPQSMAEILRLPFLNSSPDSEWTPLKKNSIRVLFSDPLVLQYHGNLWPIERLNFERERSLLVQCLKNIKKDIYLSFDAATVPQLQALANTHCGCLHFSGHGHEEALIFEDGCGGVHKILAEDIQKVIPHPEAFRFVFIAACQSQAIGQVFISAGVPHVLCCEHDSLLVDDDAAKFTQSFYCELSKGSTIKVAYDSAVGALLVGDGVSKRESEKYLLLPTENHHNVTIFDADDVDVFDEGIDEKRTCFPSLPMDFVRDLGNRVAMYKLVSALLSDAASEQVYCVVGKNDITRQNYVSAVCSYIMERLKTVVNIDDLFYIKGIEKGSEDTERTFLLSLGAELNLETEYKSFSTKALRQRISKALIEKRVLIVFDGVDDADSICGLITSLLEIGGTKILLTAEKEPSCFLSSVFQLRDLVEEGKRALEIMKE